MDDRHAARRAPETPTHPLDLAAAGEELLDTARGLRAGRAARTLLPGSPAPLTQTLLALTAGATLADHVAPGPATLQLLRGAATLRWEGGAHELRAGDWVPIPDVIHGLDAESDAVALLTVAPR